MVQNLPCCWRLGEGISEEDQRIWPEDDYLYCQTKILFHLLWDLHLFLSSTSRELVWEWWRGWRAGEVEEDFESSWLSHWGSILPKYKNFHIEALFFKSTQTFHSKKEQKLSHWGSILWKNKRISLMSSHKSPKTFTIRLSHNGKNKSEWAFFKSREWVLYLRPWNILLQSSPVFCHQKLDFFQVPKHQDFELV